MQIRDFAQQDVYFDNTVVSPDQLFVRIPGTIWAPVPAALGRSFRKPLTDRLAMAA